MPHKLLTTFASAESCLSFKDEHLGQIFIEAPPYRERKISFFFKPRKHRDCFITCPGRARNALINAFSSVSANIQLLWCLFRGKP